MAQSSFAGANGLKHSTRISGAIIIGITLVGQGREKQSIRNGGKVGSKATCHSKDKLITLEKLFEVSIVVYWVTGKVIPMKLYLVQRERR